MVMRKVRQYIRQEGLLREGDRVLVGLSGGADSVALMRLLLSLGYGVEAAHCHFRLRPVEADRDEAFVRSLCATLGVPLHVVHFDTPGEARRRRVSVEMAARDLRYAWLEQVRSERGLASIAVGHHQDDSAETLLLNLIRGTGIDGLRGIAPRRGRLVRPLLCLTRREIVDYLEHLGQAYVTDSSNLHDDYTRNKIRLHILPVLRAINPSIVETLVATADHLDQAARVYHQALEEGAQRVCRERSGHETSQGVTIDDEHGRMTEDEHGVMTDDELGVVTDDGGGERSGREGGRERSIHIPTLLREPSPEALLHHILSPLGFNSAQVRDILRSLGGQAGRRFEAKGWTVVKDRERLFVNGMGDALERQALCTSSAGRWRCEVVDGDASHDEPDTSHDEAGVSHMEPGVGHNEQDPSHNEPGPSHDEPDVSHNEPVASHCPLFTVDGTLDAPPRLRAELLEVNAGYAPERNAGVACLNADRLRLPLEVRLWHRGDRFVPLGMRGSKLVSDLLTDLKVPLHERERQCVVCSGEEIVWVVGRRIDHRYRVTAATRRVMVIRVEAEG